MRVTRRGGLKLRLEPGEDALLTALLEQLADVVAEEDDVGDPVHERLFPDAYDDEDAAREYRDITERSLRRDRIERVRACQKELATEISLDDEAADRWLRVLNDVRLALGTRLGVTEDWDRDVDPADPAQLPEATYLWLTSVQDLLVRAVTR
jgi:uncharacterized protein DUF2017